jgi:outer membrane lipoprotein-sorting protein
MLRSTAARGQRVVLTTLTAALFAAPALVSAQTATALPDAKTIIADYVTAVGGRAAFDKLQSTHSSGTFTMPALGIGGSVDIFNARPSNMYMRIVIDGVGEIRRGVNGTVAWSVDPFNGAQVQSGAELEAALEDAAFASHTRDASAYTSVETVEKTTIDGQECYKVKLVSKGRTTTNCYGADSKLIVQSVEMVPGAQGTAQVITTLRSYKKFGDVMMPTELAINADGQEQVVTISNVELNGVPATTFELPAEIKAIVK